MTVTIGLCTYQRPVMLAETLVSLSCLNVPTDVKLILVIIDNDITHSAEPVYNEYKNKLPFISDYVIEERKGIAFARNRALLTADSHSSDLMLFIDDDEMVDKNWLNAHLIHYKQNDIDVSTAPVYSIYPNNTPNWIRAGRFFDLLKNIKEGTPFQSSATGNVLFDFKKLYHQYGLRFDEKLKSREDNDFFMRAFKMGAKIQWTNTAIVHEIVPLSKMNTSWLLQRAYKGGESFAMREIKYRGHLKGRVVAMTRIPYYCIRGILILPLSLVKGYAYVVKSLQQFSIAMGMIGGIFGTNYDDYKSIHGS